jgi:hypothetical protein
MTPRRGAGLRALRPGVGAGGQRARQVDRAADGGRCGGLHPRGVGGRRAEHGRPARRRGSVRADLGQRPQPLAVAVDQSLHRISSPRGPSACSRTPLPRSWRWPRSCRSSPASAATPAIRPPMLVVRGLALGEITPDNTWHLVFKEIGVGLLNGVAWGSHGRRCSPICCTGVLAAGAGDGGGDAAEFVAGGDSRRRYSTGSAETRT